MPLTEPGQNVTSHGSRSGPRYQGEVSRRWPDGRPLCGADRGDKLPDGTHGPHKGYCKRTAGERTDHVGHGSCWQHGGNAPASVVAAHRERLEHQTRVLFGQVAGEVQPVTNPLAMYAEFAGRVVEWMRTMDSLLDDLQSPRFTDDRGVEQIRGEVQLFERSMDRCNTVLASYARLNIDDRLAQIEKRKLDLIADALMQVLQEMGLSRDQQREARSGLARRLRLVVAG